MGIIIKVTGITSKRFQAQGIWFRFTIIMSEMQIWGYSISHQKEKWKNYILLRKYKEVIVFFSSFQIFWLPVTIVTGFGDITYNSRRSIFGAMPIKGKIEYHLFSVDIYPSKIQDMVRLCRKSKWHSQHRTSESRKLFSHINYKFAP